MTEPLAHAAVAVRRMVERVGAHAFAATNPLFLTEPGVPRQCVASCIVLRIGSRVAVVTAAHALRRSSDRSYQFGAHTKLLPLAGPLRRTIPESDAAGTQDLVDLAVVLLPPEVAREVDPELPVRPEELDTLAGVDEPVTYLAIGYPYTTQRRHRRTGEVAATGYRLLLTHRPVSDYAEMALDPLGHLLLRFHKRDLYRDARRVEGPDLQGMSGGSVWALASLHPNETRPPRFAGVLTEWHRGPHPRILATRAHVALQLLLELEPSLGPSLPPLRFGNAT
jgi:hypothetical protein